MGLVDLTPAGVPLAAQEAAAQGDARGAVMAVVPPIKYAGPMTNKAVGGIDDLTRALAAKYPGVKLDLSARNGKPLILNRVVVPEDMRGQGIGSSIMREILDYADNTGATVALSPSASFGGNKKRLERWYRSMDFIPNTGRAADYEISESMYRLPKQVKP
jgi:GNAT superfamily N-acetyltransferase